MLYIIKELLISQKDFTETNYDRCYNYYSLKMMKTLSTSSWDLLLFSRFLDFCLEFLAI